MKLYYAPTSPYVRKVMILLEETGQRDDVELVNVATTPVAADPALLAKNPLAKVPALERPDGPTLFDSRVITAYLDERAGGMLYPTGARRWDTLTLEATADGILDAALLMTYEARLRPEDKRMPEWVEGQWDKVARSACAEHPLDEPPARAIGYGADRSGLRACLRRFSPWRARLAQG